MTYLGPDDMELPEKPDTPREPFTIMPGNPRLADALIKTIEQGYELTFSHETNPNGLDTEQPYTVLAPAEVDGWWGMEYPSGFHGEVKLRHQIAAGYSIRVVPS